MSNRKLPKSYKTLISDLVLPSATTISNICQKDYALTMDAIKKQLPSPNNVSLELDRSSAAIRYDL